MSSDTTSEYHDDDLSDVSAERVPNHVVVGQKPRASNRLNEKNFLRKLYNREVSYFNLQTTNAISTVIETHYSNLNTCQILLLPTSFDKYPWFIFYQKIV